LNLALALSLVTEPSSKDLILEIQSPKRLIDLTFRQNLEGHLGSSNRNDCIGFVPSGSPL